MKFKGLAPGEHFIFGGKEAQYQSLIAGEYWRRYRSKVHLRHLGVILPGDPVFAKLRAKIDEDPELCVVTSFIMPPHQKLAAYLPLDAILIEVKAHPGPIAEIRFGSDTQYLKPVNSHMGMWMHSGPPFGHGLATHG